MCLVRRETGMAPYLHLNKLLVVVFTEVVHQLHGPGLPTSGARTLAWLLNCALHLVTQYLLTTSCAFEDCRPACICQITNLDCSYGYRVLLFCILQWHFLSLWGAVLELRSSNVKCGSESEIVNVVIVW